MPSTTSYPQVCLGQPLSCSGCLSGPVQVAAWCDSAADCMSGSQHCAKEGNGRRSSTRHYVFG